MVAVETIHAVYCRLENRPGTLERAAKALADKRINVEAISLDTNGGNGFVRIVTHKTNEGVAALHASGIDAFQSELLLASLPNRIGELHRACAELAAAGLNVESILTTPEGKVALRTNDNERAAQILRKL